MQLDDMIIVSIDDHVIEPPDMFERHVPAEVPGPGARSVVHERRRHRAAGCSRARTSGSWASTRWSSWPKEEWGFDPSAFAEMRPAAYDIDERVRDMNRNGVLASMCFPTFAGFSGRLLPGGGGQGPRARHAPGVQRLAHRRVVRRRIPGRFMPARDRAGLGHGRAGRRDQPGGGQGLPGDHHARAAPHPGPAELPRATTGTRSSAPVATRAWWCACTSGRASTPSTSAPDCSDRQLHRPRDPGHGARRAGPAVGPGVPEVPRPQGRLVGGRDRLDPVPPRPRATATTRTSGGRPRLRRQAAERDVPRALAGLLTSPTPPR